MLFIKIDDNPLKDVKKEKLMQFFDERVFFKFMDSGRSGLVEASREIVITYLEWLKLHGVTRTVDQEKTIIKLQRKMIDGFIKSGTEGLFDAIYTVLDAA